MGRLQSCVHSKPVGTSIKMENDVVAKRVGERQVQPKHLVDARSRLTHPKASLAISCGAQGQVLLLAALRRECGAARRWPCGKVARR